jgi:hypothetical protein
MIVFAAGTTHTSGYLLNRCACSSLLPGSSGPAPALPAAGLSDWPDQVLASASSTSAAGAVGTEWPATTTEAEAVVVVVVPGGLLAEEAPLPPASAAPLPSASCGVGRAW